MRHHCTLLLAGVAVWAYCSTASAESSIYTQDFENVTVADLKQPPKQWSFADVHSGAAVILSTNPTPPQGNQTPLLPTKFLGEFGGGDAVHLTLPLGPNVAAVRLQFDAYLLRTWDGSDTANFGGPDIFGFGINGLAPLVDASFSNGIGNQTYCPDSPNPPNPTSCEPTWASDPNQKNRLGFNVELEPTAPNGVPAKGTPMSLVYHFDTGPIPYTGSTITFNFFSQGLQVHNDLSPTTSKVIDESWGLDNLGVNATFVPEPYSWVSMLAGLLFIGYTAQRRIRRQR